MEEIIDILADEQRIYDEALANVKAINNGAEFDLEKYIVLTEEYGKLLDELRRSITMLEDDERLLVYALFFEGLTERQYAEKIGISKTALHARKIKVLNKIKILMRT